MNEDTHMLSAAAGCRERREMMQAGVRAGPEVTTRRKLICCTNLKHRLYIKRYEAFLYVINYILPYWFSITFLDVLIIYTFFAPKDLRCCHDNFNNGPLE